MEPVFDPRYFLPCLASGAPGIPEKPTPLRTRPNRRGNGNSPAMMLPTYVSASIFFLMFTMVFRFIYRTVREVHGVPT